MPTINFNDINQLFPNLQVDNNVINFYSEIVCQEADLQLNNIFADPLNTVVESNCINFTTASHIPTRFIPIFAWQEAGLTIKKISKDKQYEHILTESPLILGEDYSLHYGFTGNKVIGLNLPITRLILSTPINNYQFLRISGTYGWQAGYPLTIKTLLSNIIINLAGKNGNMSSIGSDELTRIKSMTVEKERDPVLVEKARNEARNFLADPVFVNAIYKYRVLQKETLTSS